MQRGKGQKAEGLNQTWPKKGNPRKKTSVANMISDQKKRNFRGVDAQPRIYAQPKKIVGPCVVQRGGEGGMARIQSKRAGDLVYIGGGGKNGRTTEVLPCPTCTVTYRSVSCR